MVSASRDANSASSAQRGREDADRHASKSSRKKLTPISSELFPRLWPGATGLAEDVRYYGAWMREEAQKRSYLVVFLFLTGFIFIRHIRMYRMTVRFGWSFYQQTTGSRVMKSDRLAKRSSITCVTTVPSRDTEAIA